MTMATAPVGNASERWGEIETSELLRIITELKIVNLLDGNKKAKPLYTQVSYILAKRGYTRTAEQIRTRFKNLKSKYAEYKRRVNRSTEFAGRKPKFFDVLDDLLGAKPIYNTCRSVIENGVHNSLDCEVDDSTERFSPQTSNDSNSEILSTRNSFESSPGRTATSDAIGIELLECNELSSQAHNEKHTKGRRKQSCGPSCLANMFCHTVEQQEEMFRTLHAEMMGYLREDQARQREFESKFLSLMQQTMAVINSLARCVAKQHLNLAQQSPPPGSSSTAPSTSSPEQIMVSHSPDISP